MKKRVIIIHGYHGNPNKNWFPWLKAELERRDFEVLVPAMPIADVPQLKVWLPTLQELAGVPDQNTYLVGHSLGCITILRYLESLAEGQQVGGAVLVAGFSQPIHLTELNNYFETPLDYQKCRQAALAITCINSDNDHHVPLEQAKIMRDQLGAKLVVVENGGHLNEKAGFTELPIVLQELLDIANLSRSFI